MPNWTDAFRGAAGGAGLGLGLTATGIGAPLGIPMAAYGAAAGFLGGLLSESPEAERQRRKAELLKNIGIYKQKSLTEGVAKINKFVTGQVKNAQQGGARRALSMGRQGEAEAFITPAVSNITERGANATENYVENTNRLYDQAALNAESDFAGRPIEPSLTDVVESLGVAGLQYDASQKRLEMMQKLYGGENPTYENLNVGNLSDLKGVTGMPTYDVGPNAPVQIGSLDLPEMQNDFSLMRPLTTQGNALKPRKSTSRVDMYRNLLGR